MRLPRQTLPCPLPRPLPRGESAHVALPSAAGEVSLELRFHYFAHLNIVVLQELGAASLLLAEAVPVLMELYAGDTGDSCPQAVTSFRTDLAGYVPWLWKGDRRPRPGCRVERRA